MIYFNDTEQKTIHEIFDIIRSSYPIKSKYKDWDQRSIKKLLVDQSKRVFIDNEVRKKFLCKIFPLFLYKYGVKKFGL